MKGGFLILFIGLFVGTQLLAQTCSITAPAYTCVGDLVAISYTSSAAVKSVFWELGDGNTSVVNSPVHQYTSAGKRGLKVTITLTAGGTCTTIDSIDVFARPVANMELSDSSFCFPNTELCLLDNTLPTATSRPIVKRLVLWGDGAGDSTSSASIIKTHCYKYLTPGVYTVLMEVTDNKGCGSQTSKKVTVHNARMDLAFSNTELFLCDTNRYCFLNASRYDTLQLANFKWLINNGLQSLDSAGFCYKVSGTGSFKAQLVYTNKFGCKDTVSKSINYKSRNFTPSISGGPDTVCYGAKIPIVFTATDNPPDRKHYWNFHNETFDVEDINQDFTPNFSQVFYYPGKWKLIYGAVEFGCQQRLYDSVEVYGPLAKIKIFNAIQCTVNDTVIFHDNSVYYKNKSVFRLWNFADNSALQCTTHTALGLNVGMNCNYSRDSCAMHFYKDKICVSPKLYVKDSATGCLDSTESKVNRKPKGAPAPFVNDRMTNPIYCLSENAVLTYLAADPCEASIYKIFIDSANKNLDWIPYKRDLKYDSLPVDDSGWVNFGIIISLGSPTRNFHLKADSQIVDESIVCYDTIWYHRFLRIIAPPVVKPVLVSIENCVPFKAVIKLEVPIDIPLYRYIINWGDDSITIDTLNGASMPDSFVHYYQKGIRANVRVYVSSEQGCDAIGFVQIINGFKSDFSFNKKVCVGDSVYFRDSVSYMGSTYSPWREDNGIETLTWNFGDDSTWKNAVLPKHVYKKPGSYTVAMVAKDVNDCRDTIRKQLLVPDIRAGIKNIVQKLVCGDITRFFDSSEVIGGYPNDSIAKWFWSFGDFTTNSLLRNPFHNYPASGIYLLKHIAENTYGCIDSIEIPIRIEGPIPYFEIMNDTVACPNHLALFDNMSLNATQYIWNFGNVPNNIQSTSSDTNMNYRYLTPGVYDIFLTAADSIYNPITMDYSYCSAIFPDTSKLGSPIRRIRILPIPPVDFEMPDTVCVGKPFLLMDKSASLYNPYKWYFPSGDSLISTQTNNAYAFDSAGTYLLKYKPAYTPLKPYEPICSDSTSKSIVVVDFKVDFYFANSKDSGNYLFFEEADETAISILWNFGHPASGKHNNSVLPNPEHDYADDTGTFLVCMISESKFGCKDTVCKELRNTFFPYVILYNIFSPNGDGFNDSYDVDIEEEILYQLRIYNRYGTMVYEGANDGTTSDGNNWNGTLRNTGPTCDQGTYYYTFTYQFRGKDTEKKDVHGVVTLVR